MPKDYRGDVSPGECWSALAEKPDALLVDVRTTAEWAYVGLPMLSALGKTPLLVEWQSFPSMGVDPAFGEKLADQVEKAGGTRTSPIFFLCRSGVRSVAGAVALAAHGFENCFNVLGGFEGPPDTEGHRGRKAGWKAEGLPWAQN